MKTLNNHAQGAKKFAVILAFDVPVNREARELAESMGVRIFTADIIYHLFDQVRCAGASEHHDHAGISLRN